ncbi:MAG: alpha/beta fold hydrolase [Nevskiaceae bacterium]
MSAAEVEQLHRDLWVWRTPHGVRREFIDARNGRLHLRLAWPGSAWHESAPLKSTPLKSTPLKSVKVPLICLHLSPNSSRVYARFLAEMGRDRLAVAPDTPGFGLSTAPIDEPCIEDYAACITDLLTHLEQRYGCRQFDVMGYHTGSKIALALARSEPSRIRRIVLVSAPVYTPEELAKQQASLAVPAADAWASDGEALRRRWLEHWRWKDPAAPAAFVQREVAEGLLNQAEAPRAYRAAFAVQHAEWLPRTRQPVLLLCPDDDLREATLRARPLLQHGRFVECRGWGHGFLDVRTEAAAELIRGFLDEPQANPSIEAVAKPGAIAPAPPAARIQRAFHDGPYGPLQYRRVDPLSPAAVPLLMLHMSPNSGRIFEAALLEMGRDRLCVAPDTPGFGESEPPLEPVGIEQFARAMLSLLDHLGLAKIDVMGYHTGAITSIVLALLQPSRIRKVVQVSSPVFTDDELSQLRRDYAARALREDGGHLVESWQHLQRFYGPEVPRQVLARNFTEGLRGGPAAHWGHRAAFAHDLRHDLPRVQQPVLIVNPADDLAAHSPRGLALLPNGQWLDLPDHAHGFIDVMPQRFGEHLRAFLDAT